MKSRLLILLVLISINVFSQERKIIGRILDSETQKPIRDANIVIVGTSLGTFSNHLGFFELSVDDSQHETFIVSHIGFKTSGVRIPAADRVKFSLEKEYVRLNALNLSLYPKNRPDQLASPVLEPKVDSGLVVVEAGASFPTGMEDFYDFIGNSLTPGLSGLDEHGFNVFFTIDETGKAVDIRISDSTQRVAAVVRQAFERMANWIPATQRQNKCPQHFVLPIIRFDLSETESVHLDDFYIAISRSLRYPLEARRKGVEGVVYAEFQVDSLGNIQRTMILQDIGAACGEEVKKAIASVPRDFMKSLYDKMRFAKFVLPVYFALETPSRQQQKFIPDADTFLLNGVALTAKGVGR